MASQLTPLSGIYPLDHPRGFLVVGAAFLAQFVSFGMKTTFAVYVDAMGKDDTLGRPTHTESALVASLAAGPGMMLGVVGGIFLDLVGARPLLAGLTALLALALILSSFVAESYVALIFTYSIPMTCFNGFCDGPVAAAVGSWFHRRLALAMGIAAVGGAIGSAIIPRASGALLAHFHQDWRISWRYLALFDILMVASTILCSVRVTKKAAAPLHQKRDGNPDQPDQGVSSVSVQLQRSSAEGNGNVKPTVEESSLLMGTTVLEGTAAAAPGGDEPAMEQSGIGHGRPSLQHAIELFKSRDFVGIFIAGFFFAVGYSGSMFTGMPLALAFGGGNGANREPGTAGHGQPPPPTPPTSPHAFYVGYPVINTEEASDLYLGFGFSQGLGAVVAGLAGLRCCQRLVFAGSAAFAALSIIFLSMARTYDELMVAYCFVGFFLAGQRAMYPALLTQRFRGPMLGTVMGIGFVSNGAGALLGPPMVSQLAASFDQGYIPGLVALSIAALCSAVVVLLVVGELRRS
jgi:MFS family permease